MVEQQDLGEEGEEEEEGGAEEEVGEGEAEFRLPVSLSAFSFYYSLV